MDVKNNQSCFCHLKDSNGNIYVVKDKEAREEISLIKETINDIKDIGLNGLTPLLVNALMEMFGTSGSKGVAYNLHDTYATCSGRGDCTDIHIEIGAMAQGLPVTKIEANAFYNQIDIGKVVIPASVTEIGDSAFHFCDSIGTIELNEGLIKIGNYAFNQIAYNLTDIEIPNTVTHIGNHAFDSCYELKTVRIGKGVTYLGDGVFNSCVKLTDIYYAGTQAEWNAITKGGDNSELTSVRIHYNS